MRGHHPYVTVAGVISTTPDVYSVMIAPLLSALQSWLSFVLFTVLPIAFEQFVRWLYEWQVLLTGILAILAAHIWGRSIIKAAHTEEPRSERPAANPRPLQPERDPRSIEPEPQASSSERGPTPVQDFSERVQMLRQLIRLSLAKIPYKAAPLTAEHRALCERIATVKLDAASLEGQAAALSHFERLGADLASLEAACRDGNCRSVWEALVQANASARSLVGALGESETPSAGATVSTLKFPAVR